MVCECGHVLRDHDWHFNEWKTQPCHQCDCNDFREKKDDNT